jgi:hypothetical protein
MRISRGPAEGQRLAVCACQLTDLLVELGYELGGADRVTLHHHLVNDLAVYREGDEICGLELVLARSLELRNCALVKQRINLSLPDARWRVSVRACELLEHVTHPLVGDLSHCLRSQRVQPVGGGGAYVSCLLSGIRAQIGASGQDDLQADS